MEEAWCEVVNTWSCSYIEKEKKMWVSLVPQIRTVYCHSEMLSKTRYTLCFLTSRAAQLHSNVVQSHTIRTMT